ncbi:hypothetical protein VCHA53O466_320045 [Vibrio chagasii]|nr:hypothetical protein VCHA53O466_320045 [Vibrio chagasii]
MNTTITLPTTVEAFKSALKTGIEFYQGNPAKNKNKLNEAVAKSLNIGNYDTLSALMSNHTEVTTKPEPKEKVAVCTATIDDANNVHINGCLVDEIIFDDQQVSYNVRPLEEEIDSILEYLGEARGSDQTLMKEDIKMLIGAEFENDEFILTSNETNHYISRHVEPDLFDKVCNEILVKNAEILAEDEPNPDAEVAKTALENKQDCYLGAMNVSAHSFENGMIELNTRGLTLERFNSIDDFISYHFYEQPVARLESIYIGERDDNGKVTLLEQYSDGSLGINPDEDGSCVFSAWEVVGE